MAARKPTYTPEQEAWLSRHRGASAAACAAGFNAAFGRALSEKAVQSLRTRRGWKTGRTGRYGADREVERAKPIGATRVTADGYIEQKTNDGPDHKARWELAHLVAWEAVHGPLPTGQCLKCVDGDKANTDPSNWVAIDRALLPRLNGGRTKKHLAYDDASPVLRPTILALARVDHAVRQKNKLTATGGEPRTARHDKDAA